MNETPGRCPLCGGPMPISERDEATLIRVQILLLRQRLDEIERADISSQGVVAGSWQDQSRVGLADQERLQERIDRGLQHLEGGYGTEDRP
jgi:hypothetical protein